MRGKGTPASINRTAGRRTSFDSFRQWFVFYDAERGCQNICCGEAVNGNGSQHALATTRVNANSYVFANIRARKESCVLLSTSWWRARAHIGEIMNGKVQPAPSYPLQRPSS